MRYAVSVLVTRAFSYHGDFQLIVEHLPFPIQPAQSQVDAPIEFVLSVQFQNGLLVESLFIAMVPYAPPTQGPVQRTKRNILHCLLLLLQHVVCVNIPTGNSGFHHVTLRDALHQESCVDGRSVSLTAVEANRKASFTIVVWSAFGSVEAR